ncbi:MAG: DciA family protein [Patescibacteria group bacterium]
MPWESIKFILPRSVKNAGIEDQVTAEKVLALAKKILLSRWGDEKSAFIEFTTFSDGRLTVDTVSPSAMQVLASEKKDFLTALNQALNKKIVFEISIRRKGF